MLKYCPGLVSSPKKLIDWREKKAILFHSDDWGMCAWSRNLDSLKKYQDYYRKHFRKIDSKWAGSTLENPNDLNRLFDILEKYQDQRGRHPQFQAAYILANPDFPQIIKNSFQSYYSLNLPSIPDLWQRGEIILKTLEGIDRNVWVPTYHGMSHFNINHWLKLLNTNKIVAEACANHCVLLEDLSPDNFEFYNLTLESLTYSISQGVQNFKTLFGVSPFSAMPPNYIWDSSVESAFSKQQIKVIQGKSFQVLQKNSLSTKILGKLYNYLGAKHVDKSWQITTGDRHIETGVVYINRNVHFEPINEVKISPDYIDTIINDVKSVWDSNQPAVISSHRANFVHLDKYFSEQNLNLLDLLLERLITEEPDIHFYSDQDLVENIWPTLENP